MLKICYEKKSYLLYEKGYFLFILVCDL